MQTPQPLPQGNTITYKNQMTQPLPSLPQPLPQGKGNHYLKVIQ